MKTKKWHIIGFAFVLVFGTFMHFAYKLSGNNPAVGFIAPVNESIWEHLKLLFFPSCFYMIYEYFMWGRERKDFFALKMISVISAMAFIVTFFYTYSGVLGFNLFLLDILDFILADAICFYLSYYMTAFCSQGTGADSVKGIAVMIILAICFTLWTNNPPDLGIFWG